MYVVPAVTSTGEVRSTCCHPDAVSSVNVMLARRLPLVSHRWPVWVPLSPGLL